MAWSPGPKSNGTVLSSGVGKTDKRTHGCKQYDTCRDGNVHRVFRKRPEDPPARSASGGYRCLRRALCELSVRHE